MTATKSRNIPLITVDIIWSLCLLPHVEPAVRFTHHPPSVLYVQTGQTARFVWDYTVGDRNTEFGLHSPGWEFYDSQNTRSVIGFEDGLQGWKWAIDRNTCPTRLKTPTVRVSKESTATLVISNVTTADNGVYGCTLVLSSGSPMVSKVRLIVTVPPQFNPQPPSTKTIAEGQDLSVICAAIGPPTPNITWVKDQLTKSTGIGSASLRIPNIRRDQNGTYECQAWNNPNERPVTAQTVVIIFYKPSIVAQPSSNLKSWNGNSIRLRCFATGLPAPHISWYKPTNQQITTGFKILPGGSEVTVLTTADQGDYGQYKCRAKNFLGRDEHVINVTQLFSPGPVVAISITEIDVSSFNVTWTKPADVGGLAVTGYLLEVSTKPPVITLNTHAVITRLKENTQYMVKVYAQNVVGYGQVFIKFLTTKNSDKPPLPKLFAVLNLTSGLSVTLRWKNQDQQVDQVMKYSIYKKDEFQYDWTKVDDVSSGPLPLDYVISKNVGYGQSYQFIVTAWNRYGESIINERSGVTLTIPIFEDTHATKNDEQRRSSGGNESTYSPAFIGVLVAIAVLSLGLNLLQYLLFRNKMKHFIAENTGKRTKDRKKTQPSTTDAVQVYDNVIEMTSKMSSRATDHPNSSEPKNKVIHEQTSEQVTPSSEPNESGKKGILVHQDNTRPVYEPLRKTMQYHDSDSNTYQALGIRNQNSAYQSLNASGNDSAI